MDGWMDVYTDMSEIAGTVKMPLTVRTDIVPFQMVVICPAARQPMPALATETSITQDAIVGETEMLQKFLVRRPIKGADGASMVMVRVPTMLLLGVGS